MQCENDLIDKSIVLTYLKLIKEKSNADSYESAGDMYNGLKEIDALIDELYSNIR